MTKRIGLLVGREWSFPPRFIEEVNGRGSDKENEFLKRLCQMMDLKGTGGTDSHAISDVGKCATYFEAEIHDERELITELKAGRFYAVDMRSGQPVAARG